MNKKVRMLRKVYDNSVTWKKVSNIILNFYRRWLNTAIPDEYKSMYDDDTIADILKLKGFKTCLHDESFIPIVLWLRNYLNNRDYSRNWYKIHNKRVINLYKSAISRTVKNPTCPYLVASCLYNSSRRTMTPLPLHYSLCYFVADPEKEIENMDDYRSIICDNFLGYCIESFYMAAESMKPMLRLAVFPDQGFVEPDYKELLDTFNLPFVYKLYKDFGND